MKKFVTFILLLISMFLLGVIETSAAQFTLKPGNGAIKKGENFTVDILIDSEGEDVILARSVLTFNPDLVRVVKAERNDSLFCDYPEDEQSVDNTNGVVMLTGFCQSGKAILYSTVSTPDVFERVEFEAISSGDLVLEFEYSGEDEPFKSAILTDGSPPSNQLTDAPISGKYTIVNTYVPPTGQTPDTGYSISLGMILGGVALLIVGFLYLKFKESIFEPKLKGRTVVVYNEKE